MTGRAPTSSAALLARYRDGDEKAAGEIWRRYAERLIALARARLSKKLARQVDAEDLVQSAYRSFFINARSDRYVLRNSGDLWRLLVAITLHKLHNQFRRQTAQKRSVERETGSTSYKPDVALSPQFLAREPAPEEAAVLADEVENVLRVLRPPVRKMLELRLQGYEVAEIAARTKRHDVTVRRNLAAVLKYLQKRCADTAT